MISRGALFLNKRILSYFYNSKVLNETSLWDSDKKALYKYCYIDIFASIFIYILLSIRDVGVLYCYGINHQQMRRVYIQIMPCAMEKY